MRKTIITILLAIILSGCISLRSGLGGTDMGDPDKFEQLIKHTYPELRIFRLESDRFVVFGYNPDTGHYFVFTRFAPPEVLNEIY